MTDDPDRSEAERQEALNRRRAGGRGAGGGGIGRVLVGIMFLLMLGVGLIFVISPQTITDLFTRTSESEEMQTRTSETDTGINTEMTADPAADIDTAMPVETEPSGPALDIGAPTLPPVSEAEAERLAALERQIQTLIDAQQDRGVDPSELQDLLDRQGEILRTEFERQLTMQQELFDQQLSAARAASVPTGPTAEELAEQAARQRLEEERARRAQVLAEQTASEGIVIDGGQEVAGGGTGPGRELSANEEFLASASTQEFQTVSAGQIAQPDQTIVQGTIIEGVLETPISTELPGTLRAVVSRDVYSYDGSNVLLPRGSRLIGTYNSDVSIAQDRVLVAWNRAVTPEGRTVSLGGVGGDRLGRSGQEGFVDSRFIERFGTAALISFLSAAPQALIDDDSDDVSVDLAGDVGGDLQDTASSTLEDYLSLPPIIFVDQGAQITVFVNQDLVF